MHVSVCVRNPVFFPKTFYIRKRVFQKKKKTSIVQSIHDLDGVLSRKSIPIYRKGEGGMRAGQTERGGYGPRVSCNYPPGDADLGDNWRKIDNTFSSCISLQVCVCARARVRIADVTQSINLHRYRNRDNK